MSHDIGQYIGGFRSGVTFDVCHPQENETILGKCKKKYCTKTGIKNNHELK